MLIYMLLYMLRKTTPEMALKIRAFRKGAVVKKMTVGHQKDDRELQKSDRELQKCDRMKKLKLYTFLTIPLKPA